MSEPTIDGDTISGEAAHGLSHELPGSALVERLGQVGYLASECGLHDEAERIFSGLVKLRPKSPSPLVALAVVRSTAGKMDQAIADMRQLVVEYPDSEMAKAVLGMFLLQTEQPGGVELLQQVLNGGKDAGATNVARLCLEVVGQDKVQTSSSSAASLECFRHGNIRP